jgi:hypothetical protein
MSARFFGDCDETISICRMPSASSRAVVSTAVSTVPIEPTTAGSSTIDLIGRGGEPVRRARAEPRDVGDDRLPAARGGDERGEVRDSR